MDQRRFVSFLILSVLVLMLFNIMFPPQQPPQKPAPAAGEKAGDKRPAEAELAKRDADDEAAEDDAPPQPDDDAPAELPEVAKSQVEPQYVTLGSLDAASGYRMLVTLTNTGAAVTRAEMSSRRYSDQHDWSGYLGELELKNVATGVEVQVVGRGTPAADAKPTPIEPGDVIVGVGDAKPAKVLTREGFHAALHDTEPGQLLALQVRSGDAAPQPRTLRLTRRPLAALRPEIENYQMRGAEPPPGFIDPPSFLLSLTQMNGKPMSKPQSQRLAKMLETGNWKVLESDDHSVSFGRALPELKVDILKRYTLIEVPPESRDDADYPGYHLKLDIEFKNTAEDAQLLTYRLDGPTGMPLEGWWYAHKISQRWFSGAGLRDVVVRYVGSPELQIDCPQIAKGEVEPMGQGQALAYAGVDGQYFSSALLPLKPLEEVWFDTTEAIRVGPKPAPRVPLTYTNVTCRLTRQPLELAAGASHRDSFQVFIGPKRPKLLAQYQAGGDPSYSLKDIIYYGLALFGAVAQLMLGILHFFFGIVHNYGIAIIMLTVLVRGAMFPVSYRQTKNMARMQALKPEMDRITEKYKTDMQKRSQAMQELYRKHQINPLGGCLPVFLQLPVFIGLYRALMVDVELRQSPLFGHGIRWCGNLAAPDMLLNWTPVAPAFIENFLGPYLNVLPLVTVVLFLVTQKMSMPAPTSEQAAMQQKMMKYMTLFIGFLFYKVAAGLCLYFIASSLWGIAERKLLPKNQLATDAAAGGGAGGATSSDGKRPRDSGPNGRPAAKPRPRKAKRKK